MNIRSLPQFMSSTLDAEGWSIRHAVWRLLCVTERNSPGPHAILMYRCCCSALRCEGFYGHVIR